MYIAIKVKTKRAIRLRECLLTSTKRIRKLLPRSNTSKRLHTPSEKTIPERAIERMPSFHVAKSRAIENKAAAIIDEFG
jgi:hypothetical protein